MKQRANQEEQDLLLAATATTADSRSPSTKPGFPVVYSDLARQESSLFRSGSSQSAGHRRHYDHPQLTLVDPSTGVPVTLLRDRDVVLYPHLQRERSNNTADAH
jgi:hypothetical protein